MIWLHIALGVFVLGFLQAQETIRCSWYLPFSWHTLRFKGHCSMEGLCYSSSQRIWCLTGPCWVCDRIDGIPSVRDVLMSPGPCLLYNNAMFKGPEFFGLRVQAECCSRVSRHHSSSARSELVWPLTVACLAACWLNCSSLTLIHLFSVHLDYRPG